MDYGDFFYHHCYSPETPLEETMGALEDIVRLGKALYIGTSNHPTTETAEAAALLKELKVPFIPQQSKY